MFDPEGAILIEGGDAILRLDVFGAGLVCNFFDERTDRLFRRSVVPRCERRCLSVCGKRQRQKHDGRKSGRQLQELATNIHEDPYGTILT